MSERGPLETYEIAWRSGHVECIQAHQVSYQGGGFDLFATPGERKPSRVQFHGEFDGHWRLVLSLLEDDVRTIRNVGRTEFRDSEVPDVG